MAQFGQRLIILGLYLLTAVIISEQRAPENFFPEDNNEICLKYMGRNTVLDLKGVFNMVIQEYGLDMQETDNIMWVKKLFQVADWSRDKYLNFRECTKFFFLMG